MSDIKGKVVLITGASRGIGEATAREMVRQGASVVMTARSAMQLEMLADDLREAGGTVEPVMCDVKDYAQVEAAVARAVALFGRLDILVNNAGVIDPIGSLISSEPEEWVAAAAINYKGVYNGLRAALPGMVAQGSGIVVNISSGAATSPLEGWSHYCSAKAGALMLTRCADLEVSGSGVRVVGLSPGTVATYMQEAIRDSGINPVSQLDPSVHIPADWPARAIAWLCTEDAAEYHGQDVSLKDETVRRRIGLI